VSPSGSSYAVQLADNSAMVLSTAELEPSANIAGIQANAIEVEVPIEAQVRRLEDEAWGRLVFQCTPAVINPVDPSRLLLAVGQMQEMRTRNPLVLSNPFLQTFDLSSGHNLYVHSPSCLPTSMSHESWDIDYLPEPQCLIH